MKVWRWERVVGGSVWVPCWVDESEMKLEIETTAGQGPCFVSRRVSLEAFESWWSEPSCRKMILSVETGSWSRKTAPRV